jgi:hypothetical protein
LLVSDRCSLCGRIVAASCVLNAKRKLRRANQIKFTMGEGSVQL